MGSPLGPLLAHLFLGSMESSTVTPAIKEITFYKRYVDDKSIICDENCSLNDILKVFNNSHPAIQFTLEKETEGKIYFLDVLLTRTTDGSLKRSIYRKST
ncbi:unnamed protein product [Trichobilharzia szidati]|nr:unnamed protein product [Trichobilharzia szidati]